MEARERSQGAPIHTLETLIWLGLVVLRYSVLVWAPCTSPGAQGFTFQYAVCPTFPRP